MGSIGEKIAQLRAKQGWTLKELSRYSGVSISHISAIENETRPNPSIQNIMKLAKAFSVSLAHFDDASVDPDDPCTSDPPRISVDPHPAGAMSAIPCTVKPDERTNCGGVPLSKKFEELYDEETQAFIVSEQSGPYVALAMRLANQGATQDPSQFLQVIAQFMREVHPNYRAE